MTLESANKFIDMMKHDYDFSSRVIACKDSQERWKMVIAEGFNFTSEEIAGLKDEVPEYIFWRTVFEERAPGYDSPLGHGQDPDEK